LGVKPQIENDSSASRYGYGGFLWELTMWAMGVEHALVSRALQMHGPPDFLIWRAASKAQ
jgi:hypothetical protein